MSSVCLRLRTVNLLTRVRSETGKASTLVAECRQQRQAGQCRKTFSAITSTETGCRSQIAFPVGPGSKRCDIDGRASLTHEARAGSDFSAPSPLVEARVRDHTTRRMSWFRDITSPKKAFYTALETGSGNDARWPLQRSNRRPPFTGNRRRCGSFVIVLTASV